MKILKNKEELKKIIAYKRKEEQARLGGIPENKKITEFEYMKLNFNTDLIKTFNQLQKFIY